MPQAVGLSLQEVRQVLAIADRDDQPCGHVVSILQARLDQVRATLAELTSLGNHLAALLEHAQTAAPVEEAGCADPGKLPRRQSLSGGGRLGGCLAGDQAFDEAEFEPLGLFDVESGCAYVVEGSAQEVLAAQRHGEDLQEPLDAAGDPRGTGDVVDEDESSARA